MLPKQKEALYNVTKEKKAHHDVTKYTDQWNHSQRYVAPGLRVVPVQLCHLRERFVTVHS